MKYTEEQFFELIDAVEAADGTYLADEVHKVHEIAYGNATHSLKLGCGKPSLFEVSVLNGKPLIVCARCDNLASWPRYGGRIES